MKRFKNSGQYLGGGTCISRYDKSWFSKGSTERRRKKPTICAPAVELPPRPPEEQAEYEAFKRDYYKGGEWRIVRPSLPVAPGPKGVSPGKQNSASVQSLREQVQRKPRSGR